MAAIGQKIRAYNKTIALATTAENIMEGSATAFRFAKDVILACPQTNTGTSILIGDRDTQTFPLVKRAAVTDPLDRIRLSDVIDRMSKSGKYDLSEIFVKVASDTDVVHVLLIEPTNET